MNQDASLKKLRTLGFFLFALLTIIICAWASVTRISGAIIAVGELRAEGNRQIVQHQYGGTVDEILVEDGEYVNQGQTLIKLDRDQLQADFDIVEATEHELLTLRARLRAERDNLVELTLPKKLILLAAYDQAVTNMINNQMTLFETRKRIDDETISQIHERIENTKATISGHEAQLRAKNSQADLIDEELQDAQFLFSQGLTPKSRLLALRRQSAQLEADKSSLRAEVASGKAQINELRIEILNTRSRRVEEAMSKLSEIEARLNKLADEKSSAKALLAATMIQAPVAGEIHAMSIHTIGGVIQPAQDILSIVPAEQQLVIEAQVATNLIDEIFLGQQVELLLSAFNFNTTPMLPGVVKKVSADRMAEAERGIHYYTVEVMFAQERNEQQQRYLELLIPGMPIEVHFQTNERSPLSYLLKPIADQLNRAMRET